MSVKHWKHVLLGGIFSAGIAAAAADGTTVYEFETAPKLEPVTVKIKDSTNMRKNYFLPVTPTEGRSFALEFDLDLATFNHYAALYVGLTNRKMQKIEMEFCMRDDRLRKCTFITQALAGITARIKPFDKVEPGKMRVAIEYSATGRTVTYTLRSADGGELHTTGPVKVGGKLNLTDFVIGVAEDENEAAEVSFDPAAKALFFRSYVGVEGEYAYTVEGMLDNVAMHVEAPEVK